MRRSGFPGASLLATRAPGVVSLRAMALRLDLLRHGRAEGRHPDGDSHRALTPAGAEAVRALATVLAREPERPDRVFASPLARARETARLVVSGLGLSIEIETLDALAPECEPEALLHALETHDVRSGHALLVGHQPLMSRFARLLTGDEHDFDPGTLLRLEFSGGVRPGAARKVFARTGGSPS